MGIKKRKDKQNQKKKNQRRGREQGDRGSEAQLDASHPQELLEAVLLICG